MTIKQKINTLIVSPKSMFESAVGPGLVAFALISIPLIAMQFTSEVVWSVFDFGFAWTLIFGAGFSFQLIINKAKNSAYKIATALAVFTFLAILWVNGAVGIIGNEDNPVNLLFGFVLLMVIFGSFIANLESKAMFRVMVCAAITHILITFIGYFLHLREHPEYPITGIINITLGFSVLWILSALFYHRAGKLEEES